MSQTDTTQQAHISIHEGDTFRDELNNEPVEVLDIEGDVATVRSGGAEWRERVRDLREKVVAGDFTPTGDGISISVESKADIPAPASAQLLYPDEGTAREVADEMGLDGVHEHTLDGDTYWMPGDSHAAFEDATEQEEFAGYESFEDCVRHNDEKDDPDAYCAAIMRQVKGASEQRTPGLIGQKAEFQIGEQVVWEYQGNPVHGVVREIVDGSVSLDNGAERAEPQGDEMNYVIDEWDDSDGEYQRANVVKSGSELDESTADIPDSQINAEGVRLVPGGHSPVDQKAEFDEGAAVRWSWQGNPVHGRVAEVRPEQATVSGNTITGDEDESVYLIDEWDDRVEAYRRENVAKPESRLNESGKDLPPRSEGNYVNSEAWDSVTTVVSESDFTAPELDQIAHEHPDVLYQGTRPTEWALVAEDPVVYQADIPDKYLEGRDESLFVPNAGAAENARKVDGWKDEHGDDVAGGAPDGEGARRGNQLVEYHDRGEPLAVEYWEEILNYHERHRAQGNHELDSEYEGTPWEDAGYVSNLNWGGDAGYEQAQRVMDHVESVDQELTVEMEGAVATEQSINRDTLTEADSNRVDLDALEGELREAVEADEFYVYGKASIEQWDSDDPPTHIQMDALEGALGRFFESETAPGIISRHHQDIPVGVPVESFEFETDTTLEIGDERYQFEAGDVATSHVEDADGDGRPELWLAANISNDNEMSKKTRVLAAQGDLDGFSVTVHRNEDEMTQEGRVVTDCDLHAVTIGTGEQIKNKGSQFDVASFKGRVKSFVEGITSFIKGGGTAHTEQEATPEGVPEDYEYLSPDEEPPEDHDVVESDRGATYVSPEPVDSDSPTPEFDLVGGEDILADINEDALARPDDLSKNEILALEEGTPVVVKDDASGATFATRVQNSGWHNGEHSVHVNAPNDPDGFGILASPGQDATLVAAPDMDDLSDESRYSLAMHQFEEGTSYRNIDETTKETVETRVEQNILGNVRDLEVVEDMTDSLNAIEDDVNRAYQRNRAGSVTMAFKQNERISTIDHESGHWLASSLGYNTGTSNFAESVEDPSYVAHNNLGVTVPDFNEDIQFGEDVVEFERFLFRDEDGNVPGERRAKVERNAITADFGEFAVAEEVADTEEAQADALQDLEPGDLAMINDNGTETAVVIRAVDEDPGFSDERVVCRRLDDEEGRGPTSGPEGELTIRVGGPDEFAEKQPPNRTLVGEIDKEETAQNAAADLPPADEIPDPSRPDTGSGGGGGDGGSGGGGSRGDLSGAPDPDDLDTDEAVRGLMAEVNRAWAEAAAFSEAGDTATARELSVQDGYAVCNPHETMAQTVETMQGGKTSSAQSMVNNQQDLLFFYLAILNPDEDIEVLLEELGVGL